MRDPDAVPGGVRVMTVPTPAQVEHASWEELKGFAVRFGLNPKGKSSLVRRRILDYVRDRGGGIEWTPTPETIAVLLYRLGFHDEAARRWENAVRLEAPAPWVGLGSAHLQSGSLVKAVNCFDRALQMGDTIAHLHKAEALSAGGAHDAAAEEIQSYLAERPQDVRGWAARAALLRRTGRMDEAIEAYRVIADLRPEVPAVWIAMGCLLLDAGRDAEAAHAFEAATEIDPRSTVAWNNHGVALFRMGRRAEGMASIRRAISLDPRFAVALNNKGVVHIAVGRKAAGMDSLQAAARLTDDATIFANLGSALEKSRRATAREAYRRALEIDPADPRALAGRERLRAKGRAKPRKKAVRAAQAPAARRPRSRPGRTKATRRRRTKASPRTRSRRAAGRKKRSRR